MTPVIYLFFYFVFCLGHLVSIFFFAEAVFRKKFKARKPPINVGVLSSRRELDRINVGVLDLAVKGKKRNIYQE